MCRLYLSIGVEREEPVKIKLAWFWPADFYCLKTYSILPRYDGDPDYAEFVSLIETEKAKYWNVVKKFYLSDKIFSVADIIKNVNAPSMGTKLAAYIRNRAKRRYIDREIKEQTYKNHLSAAARLDEYQRNDIEIYNVSAKWLKKYQKWLSLDLAYSSVWSHLKIVSVYVRDAQSYGLEIDETFEEYILEPAESEPVWLTKEEVFKLLDLHNDVSTEYHIQETLQSFLFACFTGLRISDLKRFDATWLQEGEIVFEPVKGMLLKKKQTVRIPIIDPAKQFLSGLDGKILNVTEQEFNRRLKTVAGLAGIDKKLTSHVARHTFGTLLASQGVPVLTISSLMGHKKVSTTMVYIHIYENVRKAEMEKLQAAFSNFIVHRNTG